MEDEKRLIRIIYLQMIVMLLISGASFYTALFKNSIKIECDCNNTSEYIKKSDK